MPRSILKSILVSIDRSSDRTPAMELALEWAKRFEAELVGVGFIDERGIDVAQESLDKEGRIPGVNPPLIAWVQEGSGLRGAAGPESRPYPRSGRRRHRQRSSSNRSTGWSPDWS
jgi:hypothetical protein